MDWPQRDPIERPHAQEHHLSQAARDAMAEAARGVGIHGPMMSYLEGYAILREEVDEVWTIIMASQRPEDMANLSDELIQVAAVALRMAVAARRAGK